MFTSFYPIDPCADYANWSIRWFVFDEAGRTLTKNLATKTHALHWIARQLAKARV